MRKILSLLKMVVLAVGLILLSGCSHSYNSNTLGLDFYQWNLWHDTEAVPGNILPSCGWEDLDRGMGILVRIPAPLDTYFPDRGDSSVFWYHCRFSLPEVWKGRPVSLIFEHAGPKVQLFLNQEAAGSFEDREGPVELDVSDIIYHTRDNHLCIRVSQSGPGRMQLSDGVTGNIVVRVKPLEE